jgi:glucose-1-phosphate thymidylyltransferase
MKGVILAGGSGSRLFPMTAAVNKQLLPVYDKPMIYYALTTLLSASISQICIICNREDVFSFRDLLGDGSEFGSRIEFIIQKKPEGIPQAITLAGDFIGSDAVALILGDNVFVDHGDIKNCVKKFRGGASIFGVRVNQPENYGIVEFDSSLKPISLEEKPKFPKSSFAIPGFYLLDNNSTTLVKKLTKSKRGEFEIIDLLDLYLNEDTLSLTLLSRGVGWLDVGTIDNLAVASRYIEAMQKMHGVMLGSPHEVALVRGLINNNDLLEYVKSLPSSYYREYLEALCFFDLESGLGKLAPDGLNKIDD